VPAQAAPESDSGCSCSTSSQRSGYFAWLAAIGALAFVMSRRLVVRERNLK
jgi:MYXO-CTERM domain-containing protein